MVGKKIEAKIRDFIHKKGKHRDSQSLPGEAEKPRLESSRGKQQKPGSLRRAREFFSLLRVSSSDRLTEDASEDTQVLQKALQGLAFRSRISRTDADKEDSGKNKQTYWSLDNAPPSGSLPGVMVKVTGVANNQSPQEDLVGTVPAGCPVAVVANNSSDTLHLNMADVAHTRSTNDNVAKDANVEDIEKKMDSARNNVLRMKHISDPLNEMNSGFNKIDAVAAYIQPLRVFDNVVNKISEVHPYAKVALSILSLAAQTILNQEDLDQSVIDLLYKIGHVYAFIVEDNTLLNIGLIMVPLTKLATVVSQCVQFIQDYAETKGFWGRLGKNILSDSSRMIVVYNKDLDTLMQQCRDLILGAVYHTTETLHCHVGHILACVNRMQHDMGLTSERICRIEGSIERIEEHIRKHED
ncbi:hypothetical protein ID866_5681 [Astraeus odoratus]|nr:hypothetical protein ID866_5681 [Astraeus odoratus]